MCQKRDVQYDHPALDYKRLATSNPGRTQPQPVHPPPSKSFDHIMIDVIELNTAEGEKKYCLVMADMVKMGGSFSSKTRKQLHCGESLANGNNSQMGNSRKT